MSISFENAEKAFDVLRRLKYIVKFDLNLINNLGVAMSVDDLFTDIKNDILKYNNAVINSKITTKQNINKNNLIKSRTYKKISDDLKIGILKLFLADAELLLNDTNKTVYYSMEHFAKTLNKLGLCSNSKNKRVRESYAYTLDLLQTLNKNGVKVDNIINYPLNKSCILDIDIDNYNIKTTFVDDISKVEFAGVTNHGSGSLWAISVSKING